MKKILLLDNYDSFTYNLVHLVRELSELPLVVARNDKISVSEASEFSTIILSPGPGLPSEAGIMPDLVKELGTTHSILGVCLGHQCVGESFGASLKNLTEVVHGQGRATKILDPECLLFHTLPNEFQSGRYHSWVIDRSTIPADLIVTAEDKDGEIMAIRHATHSIFGVQFHPESILTPVGKDIVQNFLSIEGRSL